MARAGMSDEEMTAFLKETFCVDSTFTAAGQRVRASRLGARVCAVSKRRRGARARGKTLGRKAAARYAMKNSPDPLSHDLPNTTCV